MGLQEIDVAKASAADINGCIRSSRHWRHQITLNGVKYQNMLPHEIDALVMTLAQLADKPAPKPAAKKAKK